ncbi:MAG TPA: type II toxin-antitoxin system HicB family antitoxin [Armatimonadota bacterium]|nr:type II toxin-antitoxin system HicB family antitoxin [Armatimonadota bacterium]
MKPYSCTIAWSDADDSFIALCPEFPGVSAFGDTAEQAAAELQIAVRLAIETFAEEGWPLPQPMARNDYSGQLRLRLPKVLHAQLARRAEAEGVSLNTLLVTFLGEAVGSRDTADRYEVVLSEFLREREEAASGTAPTRLVCFQRQARQPDKSQRGLKAVYRGRRMYPPHHAANTLGEIRGPGRVQSSGLHGVAVHRSGISDSENRVSKFLSEEWFSTAERVARIDRSQSDD